MLLLCCDEKLSRTFKTIGAYKSKNGGKPTWQELVQTAQSKGVDLCASFMFNNANEKLPFYEISGATIAEVEIDILTGQHNLVKLISVKIVVSV